MWGAASGCGEQCFNQTLANPPITTLPHRRQQARARRRTRTRMEGASAGDSAASPQSVWRGAREQPNTTASKHKQAPVAVTSRSAARC